MAGKTGLFRVEWSYRGDEIPAERKAQIIDYLKNVKLVASPKDKSANGEGLKTIQSGGGIEKK